MLNSPKRSSGVEEDTVGPEMTTIHMATRLAVTSLEIC